jgi:hypothetical protein
VSSESLTGRSGAWTPLRANPESATLYYGVARIDALDGRHDNALASLRKTIELRPEARAWAREDSDFRALRDDTAFRALIRAGSP